MRSIDPFTIPSFVRSASSACVSTSTSALPMATTSVAGPALTWSASLRHGLPRAELDGDTGGPAGRSGRGPGREAVVVDRPQPATDGGGAAVERGALHERAAERLDDRPEHHVVGFLAVARTRGTRDVLVHQGAAEVVAAGLERLTRAADARLDPRDLDVVDRA